MPCCNHRLTLEVLFSLMFAPALMGGSVVQAQISLTALDTAYTENFDALSSVAGSTTNTLAVSGWLMTESGGGARDNEQYAVDTGASNTGDTYSYGSAGSGDRALGGLQSGTLIPLFGACFVNDTGSTITALELAYTGEQWRLGTTGRTDQINFEYSLGATDLNSGTWVGVSALNFVTPDTGTTGAKDGNAAASRSARSSTISSLSVAPAAGFCIRWTDTNASGADDGLAVDDFSLTPRGGEPGLPSVSLSLDPESFSELGGSSTVGASLSRPADSEVVVNLVFGGTATDGSATGGPDYSASAASISIAAGETAGSITLTANDDSIYEGDESLSVSLGTLTHAVPGIPGSVTATIEENDRPPPPSFGARIYEIQGAAHRSPKLGMTVLDVPGIVTAVASNGFYMQDGDGDGDSATSDGIFVFTSSSPAVSVGAQVLVDGTVSEFRPGGAASNLTITEIDASAVTPSSGLFTHASIAPTVIGTGGRPPPAEVIDDDSAGNVETSLTTVFDPDQDGIDFHESLEGMLVQINDGRVTGPRNSFGEIWVVGDLGAHASGGNARGGITLVERDAGIDFNPERIQLDDGLGVATPSVDVGDVLTGIRGVISYDFGNFELRLTQAPGVMSGSLPPEVHSLDLGGDRLSVGAYNVENLDPGDTSFARLAGQIVDKLGAPDILALSEVQDNNGATNDSVVAADQTLDALIDAIVAAGGPEYAYQQINPADDQDGGQPGGNIRVIQLYNPARVGFVQGTVGAGTATDATAAALVDGRIVLSHSPGRIAPYDPAWNASRKPLAVTYDFNGRRILVVNNHFNSKGGDQPLFGVNQPPLLSSEAQRRQQATLVHAFVSEVLALDPGARVLVLGDLNDFDFSPPLRILRKGPLGPGGEDGSEPVLVNLGTELVPDEAERYSYVFEGNAQELDHILATNSLLDAAAQYEALHINSVYRDQASDHDALLASFLLPVNAPPTADAGADQTVESGETVRLDGSASGDADGRITRYRWTQTAGTPVVLEGADTATAGFTAPATAGALRFKLTVTDDEGDSDNGEVEVVVAADITPASFSFVDVEGVSRSTLQISNAVTVAGINSMAPVSVVGGFFSLNQGPCTLTTGNAVVGDVLRVCHTSSAAFSTSTGTTLSIGADGVLSGVSDTFTSTTLAEVLPAVEFRHSHETVSESAGAKTVELLLDRPSAGEIVVPILYAGSARRGIDYTSPDSVTIPPGVTSHSFSVELIDDARDEPARSISMTLGSPNEAVLGSPSQEKLTIYDNDHAPAVRFDKAGSTTKEAAGSVDILIRLSAASDRPVTVPLNYGGSAKRNSDYRGPDSLKIAGGATQASVAVQILDDRIKEGVEKIVIEIGAPQNASRGSPGTHTLSIDKNDP